MKKFMGMLTAAVLVASLLAGCGGTSADNAVSGMVATDDQHQWRK